jgi:hypothetical protein
MSTLGNATDLGRNSVGQNPVVAASNPIDITDANRLSICRATSITPKSADESQKDKNTAAK